MAWVNDSLRSAISALNPFGRAPQQSVASQYFTPQLAIAAYLSSGMLRKVIDIPAQDRTREWRDWQGIDADLITKLEDEEKRLGLLAKVKQAEVLRGLGGGALILALPGMLDQAAPVAGKLVALNVVSRWQLSLEDSDENMASPTYGEPRMFKINGGTKTEQRVHPSRVIAFRGEPVPMGLGISAEDAYWGSSRLERVFAEVQKADNAALWFSELVKKAKLLRIGIPDLADMTATEGGQAKLNARIALIAQGENVLNATVFSAAATNEGAGETISDYQVSWTGIPAMMDAFDQRVAAVADIPFTRLMGRSPAGMNATGEHDAANWAASIAAGQELELRPCLERLDPYLYASAGVASSDIWWKFSPIHKPSAKEDADRFKTTADAIKLIADVNALPERAFNAGVQSVLEANGWMPGAVPELAKLSEDERFGLLPEDDGTDPSALQAEGGDPGLSEGGQSGSGLPVRRAANDKAEVGDKPRHPFDDGKRGKRGSATGSHNFDPNQPRGQGGRWIEAGAHPTVRNFVAKSVANRKSADDFVIGKVTGNAPHHVIGYTRVANAQEVRKNMSKHGDPARLINGQPAIDGEDFARIPEITRSGSFKALGELGSRKPQRIEYRATVADREYVYTETVGRDRQRLALLSFYRVR